MKKAWEVISSVFVWGLTAVAIAMTIFTVVSVNMFNRNDRDLFGYKAYIVLSDSMSATDFDAGDVVLVKEVDPRTLEAGDIIAFISQDSESYGQTITHKIRRLAVDENGEPGFITYGTTTGVDDEKVVTYPFILGEYQMALPKVGTFFQFLKTLPGFISFILIPFLLLIIYQAVNCVRLFRQYRAEIQEEKDAAEAQRRKSEEMMAELLAMKDQFMAQAPPAPKPEPAPAEQTEPQPAPADKPEVDVAAMMAELEALRAQLAASQSEEKK